MDIGQQIHELVQAFTGGPNGLLEIICEEQDDTSSLVTDALGKIGIYTNLSYTGSGNGLVTPAQISENMQVIIQLSSIRDTNILISGRRITDFEIDMFNSMPNNHIILIRYGSVDSIIPKETHHFDMNHHIQNLYLEHVIQSKIDGLVPMTYEQLVLTVRTMTHETDKARLH